MRDDVVEINGDYWPRTSVNTHGSSAETGGMLSTLSPYLRGKKTMVQAGGNCGLTVRQFVDTFETIYTFEPDPLNFYCLNLNLPHRNVFKFQSCLGKQRKMVKLDNYFPGDCGATHIAPENAQIARACRKQYVNINEEILAEQDRIEAKTPTLMIDDLALNSCDLIALDVEGYEYSVLVGAITTIRKYKPLLCLEYAPCWMERYSSTKTDIDNLLGQMGYQLVTTYKTSYSTDIIYSAYPPISA